MESLPMLSDLKQEILELPVDPGNASNGLNTKISASDQSTGANLNNLRPGFPPQCDEETVPGVRGRDLQKIKELDNFIASALGQFPFHEFIRRFAMAKGKLQRFYTYKTQIDADQGEEINENIEVMKAEILESRKVLYIIKQQIGAFKHSSQDFPELEAEELVAFEKQCVIDQLKKAKKKLDALEMMCIRLHTMIDQCSRILGGRWNKY